MSILYFICQCQADNAALTVRKLRLEGKNPIDTADLEWIFARNCEVLNSYGIHLIMEDKLMLETGIKGRQEVVVSDANSAKQWEAAHSTCSRHRL